MASASAVNNACVGSIWETMGLLSIFASALTDCLVSVVAECEESVSKSVEILGMAGYVCRSGCTCGASFWKNSTMTRAAANPTTAINNNMVRKSIIFNGTACRSAAAAACSSSSVSES